MTKILINNIKIRLEDDEGLALSRAGSILAREGLSPGEFKLSVYKRSVDARNKNDILLVYTVMAECEREVRLREGSALKISEDGNFDVVYGDKPLGAHPVVVGMGPAGMFCALLLAEHGYRPILIDRGDDVEGRAAAVERFISTGVLDTESNIQFGAGGAGTFSDGKLMTRINDPRCAYVLEKFTEHGAPAEIKTKAKPHIGTDILRDVVKSMLARIEELGGEVVYRCRMDGIEILPDCAVLRTTKGDIEAGVAVLALGHSSRDTYRMLLEKNFVIAPKPFSVGVRVEHLQSDIDSALYGKHAGDPRLGVGEYNLSDTTGDRGVYTFCMCPGGEVVPATSMEGGVCVNGMSRYARDGRNANCAVNVSVYTSDCGNSPIGGIELQEELERRAYIAGGQNYGAPIQLMGDFLTGTHGHAPGRIMPTYAGGARACLADLSAILPDFVSRRLGEGFLSFDRKIRGFAVPDAVLTGIETRTSAPLRIMRDEELCAIGQPRIYPCGEGAGYAGGIMSSAVDGIKVALEIMKKYKI